MGKLGKSLFWICITSVLSFLLVNVAVDFSNFSDEDDTRNILYCGAEQFTLNIQCDKNSDCISYEIARWSNRDDEWDFIEGIGDINENFNKLLNSCTYCSDNKCLSSVAIKNVNY